MQVKSIFATLAISIFALSSPANAEIFGGKLNVKVGVAGVLPDESADISPIGGDADISDEAVPALILEYDLSSRISVELFCCVATHEVMAVDTAIGAVDLGEITLFPPVVTAKYRLLTQGPIRPYVGAGVNFTAFFNEDIPAGPVNGIEYDSSFGPAIQIGADVPLNERWSLNVDLKKVWIRPDVSIDTALGPVSAEVEIDPILAFVGVGYRF